MRGYVFLQLVGGLVLLGASNSAGAQRDATLGSLGAVRDNGEWHALRGEDVAAKVRLLRPNRGAYLDVLESAGAVPPRLHERQSQDTRKRETLARDVRLYDILDHAALLDFDDPVELILEGVQLPFNELGELRSASDLRRSAILSARERSVREAQRDILDALHWYGATLVESQWLLNRIRVKVPAGAVEAVLAHPDVVSAYPAWRRPESHGTIPIYPLAYDGKQIREQTGAQDLIDQGYHGESGGRSNTSYGGDNVKIAITELHFGVPPIQINFINESHPGWRDWANGPSRIAYAGHLSNGGPLQAQSCTNPPPLLPPVFRPFVCDDSTHGTIVASLAAGSIEQNQDPNVTDPTQQSKRSGMAREAALMYFISSTYGGMASALFTAAVWGADVVNMSWGAKESDCSLCDPACDEGGMNQWFRILNDLGVVIVSSPGNKNNDANREYPSDVNCNVQWPATRTEVIAAGGVAGAIDYRASQIADFSARGWMPVGVGGWLGDTGFSAEIPPVSLSAPGVVQLHYTENDTYSDTSQSAEWGRAVRGTSFSSPIVAGGAAILRHAYPLHAALGTGYLRALMLVMAASEDERETYGVGKLMLHQLSNLSSPAGWYSPAFHISEGEQIAFPFPGTTNGAGIQFKFAIFADEPDPNNTPWITVAVIDTCNGDEVIAADTSIALEKQLDITVFDYFLPNACLEVQLYGASVADAGVTVYTAGYFHNALH